MGKYHPSDGPSNSLLKWKNGFVEKQINGSKCPPYSHKWTHSIICCILLSIESFIEVYILSIKPKYDSLQSDNLCTSWQFILLPSTKINKTMYLSIIGKWLVGLALCLIFLDNNILSKHRRFSPYFILVLLFFLFLLK